MRTSRRHAAVAKPRPPILAAPAEKKRTPKSTTLIEKVIERCYFSHSASCSFSLIGFFYYYYSSFFRDTKFCPSWTCASFVQFIDVLLTLNCFQAHMFSEVKGDSVLQGLLSDSIIEDSAWLHDGKGQFCTKTNINRHVSVYSLTCGSIY